MSKIVFSGIQPSGNLHIGNYLGAVRHWVRGQENGLNIFCIVDLHAITVPQDPKVLREKTLQLAALILAAGIDPEKSLLFVQSHNPDHANLGWIFNCVASMGELSRMTQFKDKSEGKDRVSVGLFDYPALMAADILLYDTTEVPVGEDQKQHVELTRDIAERFNTTYGETFVLPKPVIPTTGGRIMSLLDPSKKMSKSDENPNATIGLLDPEEVIRKKIAGAVTDSQNTIQHSAERPGISNLIDIYSQFADLMPTQVQEKYVGKGYKEFKQDLAQLICDTLLPLQERYNTLRQSGELEKILATGAEKSYKLSHKKLVEVYQKVGFVTQ
jgi:tryptophanyl-tRNA synthetase